MSRADKQLRRKLRLEKKNRRSLNRAWLGGLEKLELPEDGKLRLISYDITFEPLELPGESNRQLEEAMAADGGLEALHAQVYERPAEAIAKLRRLIERLPNVPLLHNWLAVCLSLSGNHEEAERVRERTYERFPDYLFAKASYADLCMHRDQVDKVPEIFDGGKFDLKALYPHRNVFHLTEFLAFAATMVQYFLRIDNQEQAELYLEAMEEMAPEHEVTVQTREIATHLMLLLVLERMKNWVPTQRRRRRRRRASRKGEKDANSSTEPSKS